MNRQKWKLCAVLGALALAMSAGACTSKPAPTEVVIALNEKIPSLTQATILVDYSQAAATPVIKDGRPACTIILPNVDAEFSDDGAGALTIEAKSSGGFSGPVDLAVCRMTATAGGLTAAAIAEQLQISLAGGTDTAGQRLDDKRLAMATRGGGGKHKDRAARDAREATGGADAESGQAAGEAPARNPAVARPMAPRGAVEDSGNAAGGVEPQGQVGGYVDKERLQAFDSPARDDSRKSRDEVLDELDEKANALSGNDSTDQDGVPESNTNDDTDNDRQAIPYAVQVGVTTESGQLAALQFDIRFSGSGGGWLGAGGRVVCTQDVPVALATFNDRGGSWLSAAMVDLAGFPTPGPVATCTFKSRSSIDAGSFQVTVIDASGTEVDVRPDPFPQMAVTNVQALR